jgi:hypothetical protein
MKEVFVTQNKVNKLWKVIDKKTDKVIEEVDDVLLFNATFKRFKKDKGWHGIVSEQINPEIIKLLKLPFHPLTFIPKKYYPRRSDVDDIMIKDGTFIRFKESNVLRRGSFVMPNHMIEEYCREYYEED